MENGTDERTPKVRITIGNSNSGSSKDVFATYLAHYIVSIFSSSPQAVISLLFMGPLCAGLLHPFFRLDVILDSKHASENLLMSNSSLQHIKPSKTDDRLMRDSASKVSPHAKTQISGNP